MPACRASSCAWRAAISAAPGATRNTRFSGGEKFTLDQVEQKIAALAPVKLVEFTGGEPMLQERELLPLMDRLLSQGYTLLLETSGERPLDKRSQSRP